MALIEGIEEYVQLQHLVLDTNHPGTNSSLATLRRWQAEKHEATIINFRGPSALASTSCNTGTCDTY
jgi:hypothetical protein